MAEENQVMKEPQQQQVAKELKEPQRVTTENPKKVEAGKRLAESSRKKREVKKREEQAKLEASGVNQYYEIEAVIALGVIGGIGYYNLSTKKVEQQQQNKPHPQMQLQTNKFEMD